MTNRNRRAATLVEMVIVIALVALLGSVTFRLFHSMMRQQTATSMQLTALNSETQLRLRFSQDVNLALDFELSPEEVLLRLPGSETVQWSGTPTEILRTKNDESGQTIDRFEVLSSRTHVLREESLSGGRKLIAMELEPSDQSSDNRNVATNRRVLVTAEFKRDHRWAAKGEAEEDSIDDAEEEKGPQE